MTLIETWTRILSLEQELDLWDSEIGGLRTEDQVSRFVDHYPTACAGCGFLLMGDDEAPERIQTIELPPVAPIVEEHRIHSLTCPACGVVTKSDVPPDLRASPFGPRLQQRDRGILDWLVTARLAQINGLPAPALLPTPTTP